MSERTKLVIEAKNFPRLLETEFFNTIGRLPSFSQILYKNFMYFRVWGNYGHTPDTWHGHVIGQRTSQYGQQETFPVTRVNVRFVEKLTFTQTKTAT